MRHVIVVSGPIAVGKSFVLREIERRFGAIRVSTRAILLERTRCADERGVLQSEGERLDRETEGGWVADGVRQAATMAGDADVILVDAARIKAQVDWLRRAYGGKVLHVHLTAPLEALRERYLARPRDGREFDTYDAVRASSTEAAVGALAEVADVVVDTGRGGVKDVVARLAAGLGLFPPEPERLVDVLVGAQFGSEGKGNVCAHLAPGYEVLMRVGGPNAGHRVAHPAHDYVQIPSGTLSNERARILIGAGATINEGTILGEIAALGLTAERLVIDPQAMIIEPSDMEFEGKTFDAIGSTKKGVGAATARKVVGRDGGAHLGAFVRLAKDVESLKPYLGDTKEELERAYAAGRRIMLEGTQGTDLSLHHGPYPKVTSRETTASGCLADAGIAPLRVRRVIMVTRTYPIRVGGDSGELPGELTLEVLAARSHLPLEELRKTEVGTISGKQRRIGEFSWEQLRRSAVLNGATDVALTFVDYIDAANQRARRFEQLTPATRDFVAEVERVANAPVSLLSTRFHARSVIDRRTWR